MDIYGASSIYRILFEQSPAFICVLRGEKHIFEAANPKYMKLIGNRNVLGRPAAEAFPETIEQGFLSTLDYVYKTGQAVNGSEIKVALKSPEDGSWGSGFVDLTYQPLRDEMNQISGVLVHGIDVTERVVARKQHYESESRFQIMADSAPVLVWISNPDKLCTWFNKAWLRFTGRTIERELHHGWMQNVHPSDLDKCKKIFIESFDARREFKMEFRLLHHSGEYRWILGHGVPRFSVDGSFEGYIGACVDITDQKHLSEALRVSEERLELAQSAGQVGTFEWDLSNDRFIWSEALERMYGFEPGSFENSYQGISSRVHPDDQARVTREILNIVQGDSEFNIEFRVIRPNQEVRWFLGRGHVIRNLHGKVTRFLGVNVDITDQVQFRENVEKIAKELEGAVHARDKFLSIASHELKTPLTSLKLHTQSRQLQLRKNQTDHFPRSLIEQDLAINLRQINRLSALIEDMLDVSRIHLGKLRIHPEFFNICDLVREVSQRFRETSIAEGCSIDVKSSIAVIEGYWDRFRLEQVILNLLTNAIRYGKKSPISIQISIEEDVVLLSVQDQGMGIPKEHQERIFQRFERAISADEISGLGLGLYISREIITSHGGTIDVVSELNQGATFIVKLPTRKSNVSQVS